MLPLNDWLGLLNDILPVVLYEYKAWSLTPKEKRRWRVLRRIFGPKMAEVIRGRRKLHDEELHNFYASPYVIRVVKTRRKTCMKGMKMHAKFESENVKKRDNHLEDSE
jgi:hypothetical protein